VQAAVHAPDGRWTAPTEISRPGIGARPTVAVDSPGDAVIAWAHDIGRDRVLQATYRRGAGGAWPEPNDLSEAVLGLPDFEAGIDQEGNAVAGWAERTEAGVALRVASRNAASGGWGAARTISRPGTNVTGGPAIVVSDGGIAVVLWIEEGVVREAHGNIRSDFWFVPAQISPNSGRVAFGTPDVALDQATGEILAVWASRTGTTCCTVEAASYTSGRGRWEAFDIGALRSPADMPRVAIRNDTGVAVWVDALGVESAVRTEGSQGWSRPTLVSGRTATAAAPEVSVDSHGNAVAVWTDSDTLRAALRPRASGRWQAPVDVSTGASAGAQVAMDGAGRGVVVWNRQISQQVAVMGANLDNRGPVLDGLSAPRTAVATGTVARFSIRPTPWAAPLAGVPEWIFGDGGRTRGTDVSHVYRRAGPYVVTVSQSDERGDVSTTTTAVRIVAPARSVRRPSITGSRKVGALLTCRRGTWAGSPPMSFKYRWRRNGEPIARATGRTHRIIPRDAGSRITCVVIAANPAGSVRAISRPVPVES
jgi:hypothetical protein